MDRAAFSFQGVRFLSPDNYRCSIRHFLSRLLYTVTTVEWCLVFCFCLQFSHMIELYHSLGPEKFPLNEQTFYPNHTQMVSAFLTHCLFIMRVLLYCVTIFI